MTDPLRLAVVGAGHLGRIHARLATQLDGVELVGVVDPIPSAAKSTARETDTRPFTNLEDIWDGVDAAIVATPTVTHDDVSRKLLNHGIHALVEKPLTNSVATSRELVQTAEKKNLVLQVGHVERFNPAFEAARDRMGDVKYIEARRVGAHTFRSTDIGVVHDLMIHDIDLLLSIVPGPIADVQALGVSVLGDSEDIAQATIRFENGCIANLVASRVSLKSERSWNAFTSTGFVGFDMQSGQVETVDVGQRLRNGFVLSGSSIEERPQLREELFAGLMHHRRLDVPQVNAILEEQRDFLRSIRGSTKPRVDGSAAVAALQLAEQILSSIAAHQWDGSAMGRVGPFALSSHDVLPHPRLSCVDAPTESLTRKAG